MFSDFFEKASSTTGQTSAANNAKKKRRGRSKKEHNSKDEQSNIHEAKGTVAKRKSSPNQQQTPHQLKPPKRRRQQDKGPSEAALILSAKLKECSAQKRLNDALQLYWDDSNDNIRDAHHACIVIDCSARCGAIAEGEKVYEEMKQSGMRVNVQAQTALLKGYAHAGMIHKGAKLFRDMCHAKDKRNRPNVRTLNTLLRGCLWTATTSSSSGDLEGGVITSEASWNLFRKCVSKEDLDCSSYEYYIAQLCYALRVEDAKNVIEEMKRRYNLRSDEALRKADPSIVESLAVSLVALARAMTLLDLREEGAAMARSALHAADIAKRLFQCATSEQSQGTGSTGGKRCWKRDDSNSSTPRRAVSNALFRSHRLAEVQSEASDLVSVCSFSQKDVNETNLLAFHLLTRLLYFSGGGTTDLSASKHDDEDISDSSQDTSSLRCQLMGSLWHSFGLEAAMEDTISDVKELSDIRGFSHREWLLVQNSVGLSNDSLIDDDGFIDFREVFRIRNEAMGRDARTRPLDIELGSGFGDWIVHQAISNPERDYVAVELRADRVAQTFSKGYLNGSGSPLNNLCSVGSECGSFLRKRVRDESVSTIFVNHPEPPTQTYGANDQILVDIANGGEEPAHMLSSATLIVASKCLQSNGRFVVVTDNRFYARLICVTLVKAMKTYRGLFRSFDLSRRPGIQQVDRFGDSREYVALYEGQPSDVIGHSVKRGTNNGSSYFDRLWRSGAGTHAERRKRFIIVMERMGGEVSHSTRSDRKREDSHSQKPKRGKQGKKNRKKSEAKQRRRNERRLAKRSATNKEAEAPAT